MQRPKNIVSLLYQQALSTPDRDALVSVERSISYSELAAMVEAEANELLSLGVTSAAVMGIRCANDIEHLIICLAGMRLEATTFTIPTFEMAFDTSVFESAGTRFFLVEQLASGFSGTVPDNTHVGDLGNAQLLFSTSGTSGKPKIVVHSSAGLIAQAHRHVDNEHERFACIASVEHNFSKRHRFYVMARGATNVFLDSNELLDQCISLNVETLHVSEYQARSLVRHADAHRLQSIGLKIGGSHVSPETRKLLTDSLTPNLRFGYGTTETGAIAFAHTSEFVESESVGRALNGLQLECRDAAGVVVEPDQPGVLFVRGEGMFEGYLGAEEVYQKSVKDGWYCTGDIARIDQTGSLFILGRSDDMFVFNSMNIYPQELESLIMEYPGVADAAVVPRKSRIHGDVPIAILAFDQYASPPKLSRIQRFVSARAGARSPKQFILVNKVPRGETGKVNRQEVLAISGRFGDVRTRLCEAIRGLPSVMDFLGDSLDAFEAGEEDVKLRTLGMDSMTQMELLILVEMQFDVVIDPGEFADYRLLSQLVATISAGAETGRVGGEILPEGFKERLRLDDHYTQLVKTFRRVFRLCSSIGQLNKALQTFEHRLAPEQLAFLAHEHSRKDLVDVQNEKFQNALDLWFTSVSSVLMSVGEESFQRYQPRKIAPTVTLFDGGGDSSKKVLVICFAMRGRRRLIIPNFALLQCADASRFNFLIIAEPLGENYSDGVPSLGSSERQVIRWLGKQKILEEHAELRTIGSSAGAYMAIVSGLRFKVRRVLSIGGRFPRFKKQKSKALLKAALLLIEKVRGGRAEIVLSHARDDKRDAKFAQLVAKVTDGEIRPISSSKGEVGHRVLDALLGYGELEDFLKEAIFF